MGRHAAHRNVFALMLAAFGQRDVQRGRGGDRIVKEHFVEIAHPVKQQRIGVFRLDVQILRHHRRDLGCHRDPPATAPTLRKPGRG